MRPAEIKEIEDYAQHVIRRNDRRIPQQRLDQSFYDDTYKIPIVEDEKYIIRTGYVSGLVNGITQQAIAYVPKVYTEAKNKTSQEGADRVASLANKWVKKLSNQSVHPFRQTFKWMMGTRGEAWVFPLHDQLLAEYKGDWREEYPDVVPVHFVLYDPMVVFHDPSEDVDGKPSKVVVHYKRTVADLKKSYPLWSNKSNRGDDTEIEFYYYIDGATRYAYADGEALFRNKKGKLSYGDGRLSNLYGSVPAVHKYSGYGSDSEAKDPADLAYTRTRMIRSKIEEDSAMATDFRYNQHELAWAVKDIYVPDGVILPKDILKNYKRRPNTINIIEGLGGAKIEKEETSAFDASAYAYRQMVKADLNAEYPLPVKGVASGTSGRQEDILGSSAMAMYDSPIEANAMLWAEALDLAFKICSVEKLDILPKGLNKEDCKSYTELKVDIRKEDPQDMSRKAAEGDRRFEMGIIDEEELYIEYMGKTKEEAQRLKARVWISMAMRNDPAFMQAITQTAAEEMGIEERLNQIREQMGGGAINPVSKIGSKGGKKRIGNIQSPLGAEMGDVATRHEERLPPR